MRVNETKLRIALSLWEKGELDSAMDIVKAEMKRHPEDPRCLGLAAHVYEKANNTPVAYNLFKRCTELQPTEASHWLNFGRCAEDLQRVNEAERAYSRALSQTSRESTRVHVFGNLAALNIDQGKFKDAMKWIEKALALDPSNRGSVSNLGFCKLAQGDWSGWAEYGQNIGTDYRKKVAYGSEPQWDGSTGQTVVLYGEQGLGDEICFASMVEDAVKDCRRVILDCDHRLKNLFERSFPQATVYGTRHTKKLNWAPIDRDIDASIPAGQIAEFYRKSPKDCPQSPYLFADPERVAMWKALWATKKKPVIGIAWSGGIHKTGADTRFAPLSEWGDLLGIDAHFVSLQYRDSERHPKVHEYPYATRTQDYDDTAALVASLDCVVAVPTAVVHLAGALGTRVIAMHGPIECWKYAQDIPFHPAEHVKWQGSWKATIAAAAELISGQIEKKAA